MLVILVVLTVNLMACMVNVDQSVQECEPILDINRSAIKKCGTKSTVCEVERRELLRILKNHQTLVDCVNLYHAQASVPP